MSVAERALAWLMSEEEQLFLDVLPEIVELWYTQPHALADEFGDLGTYYLSAERATAGARSLAHQCVMVRLDHVFLRSEYVIGIDLDRQVAQVATDHSIARSWCKKAKEYADELEAC